MPKDRLKESQELLDKIVKLDQGVRRELAQGSKRDHRRIERLKEERDELARKLLQIARRYGTGDIQLIRDEKQGDCDCCKRGEFVEPVMWDIEYPPPGYWDHCEVCDHSKARHGMAGPEVDIPQKL